MDSLLRVLVFEKRFLLVSLLRVFALGSNSLGFFSWVNISCWIRLREKVPVGFTPEGSRLGYSLLRAFVLR